MKTWIEAILKDAKRVEGKRFNNDILQLIAEIEQLEKNNQHLDKELHGAQKLYADILILIQQQEAMREAITDKGRLKAIHFETWANTLKEEKKYKSELVCLLQRLQQVLEAKEKK